MHPKRHSGRHLAFKSSNRPYPLAQTQARGRDRAASAPDRLLDALADFGDSELVLAGLHENLHRARFLDTHFRHTAGVLEALGEADVMARAAHRAGDFSLHKYLPAAALRIRAEAKALERCPPSANLTLLCSMHGSC